MKNLILTICLLLTISGCYTPKLYIAEETRVLMDNNRIFAVITPANITEAYLYMKQLEQKGYDCNKQNSECIGENTYICRVFDTEGKVYLIVKRK